MQRMLTQNTMQSATVSPEPVEAGIPASIDFPKAYEPDFSKERCRVGTSEPRHILIVDDDPAVRELVAETVARAGFRADTAEDGEEGWEALCLTAYDLIITDNEMPRLTGLDLIKRLRKVSIEPPCILISGSLSVPETTLGKMVHPGAVLAKPFSAVALIEKVYDLLLHGDFQES